MVLPGYGKTTLIRCLNRMNEMTSSATVKGSVYLDDIDIYANNVDPVDHQKKDGDGFPKAKSISHHEHL